MDYSQHMTAHRRLTILEILNNVATYTAHEVDIKNELARQAQAVGTDSLRADLQWLHEQGLVLANQPGGVWFATLTAKGGDVRQGLSTVPGVARPEPK
ncbi:hypothetical protein [Methylomonas sp. ZR1]|uniref:VpaChn25_0724 family phage protein n=1 Tax=Methylomonas sp. ZR1 TaxID=1797072 RepID=UPI0014925DDD|nr:hypothetical protein [Methylomonas sp. ZR1]NOV29177.1 hypothetical protein [Methylomonas sp. ZR1]